MKAHSAFMEINRHKIMCSRRENAKIHIVNLPDFSQIMIRMYMYAF